MNAKKNSLQENEEVDLGVLLSHLWEKKIIIILVSILSAVLFFIYTINLPKKYQSQIFIKKPPSVLFENYKKTYYFDLNSDETHKIMHNNNMHVDQMAKVIDDNFAAHANFDEFKNFYKKINFENIRFEKIDNKKDARESYILIFPEGIDGYSILRNYADFILSISKKEYKSILELYILSEIQNLEKQLSIANKIELVRPLELLPDKNIIATNKMFQGSVILTEEIAYLKKLLNNLNKDKFDYKFIIDHTPAAPYKQKSVFFYTLSGLIFGFFLSLITIYFKSILLIKKN